MKKLLMLVAIAVFSSGAMAQTVTKAITVNAELQICAAASADPVIGMTVGSPMGDPVTTTGSFVKVGFKVKCGANSYASINNGYGGSCETCLAVAGGSTKGNQTYRGGATVGGVSLDQGCPVTGCTATEVTAALGRAVTNGS